MVHLGFMKLNVLWNLSSIRIGWHWSCVWGTDRVLKILPIYSELYGWLHCHPEETMLPLSQLWLDGWRVCLYFAMDFTDAFFVDDPLAFCYFLEGGLAVNIFMFGSRFWIFFFHQVRCAWIIFGVFYCIELWFHSVWCASILLESSISVFIIYLVDPVPFHFLQTLYCFFACFVRSNPIRWHLKLLARALLSEVFLFLI